MAGYRIARWSLACLLVLVGLSAGRGVAASGPWPAGGHAAARAYLAQRQATGGVSRRPAVPAATGAPTPIAAGTAPGTCLAFGPPPGPRVPTVFIDAGHGGVDPGTSGTTTAGTPVQEKTLTLATALALLALLRAHGDRVVMARVTDTLLLRPRPGDLTTEGLTISGVHHDLEARIACANTARAAVLVGIHFNAFADPTVNGAETLYDSARPFRAANLRLAVLAQSAVVAQLRARGWAVPDRGVVDDAVAGTPALSATDATYGHLIELGPPVRGWLDHPSAMPGIVCEPLFLTHPAEADVAASAQGQQAVALGLAQAITAYLRGRL